MSVKVTCGCILICKLKYAPVTSPGYENNSLMRDYFSRFLSNRFWAEDQAGRLDIYGGAIFFNGCLWISFWYKNSIYKKTLFSCVFFYIWSVFVSVKSKSWISYLCSFIQKNMGSVCVELSSFYHTLFGFLWVLWCPPMVQRHAYYLNWWV